MVRGGRVLDPASGVDRVADLVLVDDRVLGLDVPAPPGADEVDARGAIVSPGWIDAHTHVFGDIGVDDPDTAGVLAGVTTLVDAGSAGSLTVDELLDRGRRCRTEVYAIAYLDRRGIADTTTIPTSVSEIPAVPVGELRRAVDRHGDRIVAVKTGIYADLGAAWIDLALAAAELIGRPAFFHVGNFKTHSNADARLMARFLDRLRPGDVVTHCYTGLPGGLVDEGDELLPEALAAAGRGVLFDVGHSGAGFDLAVARRSRAAGLVPTSVSSDVAVFNVRQRVRNLAHVLGNVSEVGFGLTELVAMVTAGPASAFGLPGGTLAPGAPADVTVFAVDEKGGRRTFRPRTTLKAGRPIAIDLDAVLAEGNLRFRVLAPPGAPRARDEAAASLLDRLARCVPHLPADGEVIQQVVAHLAGEAALDPGRAAETVRRAFADRAGGNQVGWLLAEAMERSGAAAVADRLAVAADVVRPRAGAS